MTRRGAPSISTERPFTSQNRTADSQLTQPEEEKDTADGWMEFL